MEFRSTAQINEQVLGLLPAVTGRYDCVAACSEYAMLAAELFALHLRVPAVRIYANQDAVEPQGRRVLFVELAIEDMRQVTLLRDFASNAFPNGDVTLTGVFATESVVNALDLAGELVTSAPSFEWNFLQREGLEKACIDIDGVLCEDPSFEQNDDGARYLNFLESARPLHLPSGPVGWVVSSRLEKYREKTENWLAKHGVIFDELCLLDLPDKETRRALNCHGSFKSDVYASVDADLFIESDRGQAREIARRSGKPVFCVATMGFVDPTEEFLGKRAAPSSVGQKRLYRRARSFTKRLICR